MNAIAIIAGPNRRSSQQDAETLRIYWPRDSTREFSENGVGRRFQKLRGHYAYYGITGNSIALSRFREEVKRVWRKWLVRRKRGNRRPWSWFIRLQERFPLPNAVAVHSVIRSRSESVI